MLSSSEFENQPSFTLKIEESEYSLVPEGRQEIKLHLHNMGEAQAYIELAVRGVPEEWVALSAQVLPLEPGGEGQVTLSIRPPAQTQPGIYPIRVIAFTQGSPQDRVEAETTLRIATFFTPGRISVMMEATQFSVSPGSSLTIPLLLQNRGLETDTFHLGVEGIPVSWFSTHTPQVQLTPGEQTTVSLNVHPPQSPSSKAGRHRFKILVKSQLAQGESAEVECVLAVLGFSKMQGRLEPDSAPAGTPTRLHIENLGNFDEAYQVSWASQANNLVFETVGASGETINLGTGQASTTLRVPAGQATSLIFRARPARQPILGGEKQYAYALQVRPADRPNAEGLALNGKVSARGLIPTWVIPVVLVICLSAFCITAYLFGRSRTQVPEATRTAAAATEMALGATQTIVANQTAAAESGQQDLDGDGLTDTEEAEWATDPNDPDSDGDDLFDGDEINIYSTNPLIPDSDQDGLSDGDEVLRRATNPLNADSDADGLLDGDEAQRTTDPLNPDTDRDELSDGDEIELGTDPLNPDSDSDQLLDGRESPPCPNPLDPDSDDDGTIDSSDLDPCDANNPSLTGTVAAGAPTVTPIPTETVAPATPTATGAPPTATEPSAAETPAPATFQGVMAFESNRDGNPEIYLQNGPDGNVTRLTNSPGLDTQPAWSPNGQQLAITTNRDGNNEIYLINADGGNPINLSNNPGDDQFPSWSPDGNWVAFSSDRSGNWEVYASRVDGSEILVLTNNPGDDLHPVWLGNEQIIFASNRDGNFEIYSLATSDANLVNISNNPANDNYPSYSIPNNQIAFNSDRDGNWEVYTVPISGGQQTNVSNNAVDDLYPRWSPDGAWIAFASNRDGNNEIYAVSSDATTTINLSANAANDLYPAWR